MNIYPAILCGGSGARLWSMSRDGYPKQYPKFIGEHTLVQQTVFRLRGIGDVAIPIVIVNEEQRFLVVEQLCNAGVKPPAIMLEPIDRDMTPAVVAVALLVRQATPKALLLVLSPDHVIEDNVAFGKFTTITVSVAKDNFLVTFGIEPTESHTEYGYIRGGETLVVVDGIYQVERFVEESNVVTAARLLEEGGYYWNSGVSMLKMAAYLDELRQHAPEILRQAELALSAARHDADLVRFDAEVFGANSKLSIDCAVMEKTARAVVVTATGLGWNSIGPWTAPAGIANVDDNGSVLSGDVLVGGVRNTYVQAEYRMVAAVGVNDLAVVETVDVILVSYHDRVQDVKKIVKCPNNSDHHEPVMHHRVFRPRGSYEGIDQGKRSQVKCIIVSPDSSLGL